MPLKHCGATPLHQAALRGHNEMCEFLLDHGADIDARDDEFNAPPIGWANETGSQETVELLARRGTSLTLMLAAACGLTEKVREILARDPGSLNRSGGYGTALHAVAVWGRLEIAKFLIEHGADVTLKAEDGCTPLEIATHQEKNGNAHTSLVSPRRKREIEEGCREIAAMLKTQTAG